MKCNDVYLYICDNLDQHLDSPRCREIRKHIEGCPDCTAYLDSLKKTIVLYRSAPATSIPQAVHRRLIKLINTVADETGQHAHTPKRKPASGHSKHR